MDDTSADSREGSQFGPYRLRRLVGRGGMGNVYEAEDTVRERIVALKLMSPALSNDPVFRSRMQREARTAGRLHEPHVVPIHDFGEIDGQLYVDMRLIDGKDLAGNGVEDRTDGELAQLAKTVGAGADAIACIKSGDELGTAKTKAANGYSTLSGVNANSTPFVWDGTRAVNYQDPSWLTKLTG